jgi:membrane-bound lytic murein transglycosylase MltF
VGEDSAESEGQHWRRRSQRRRRRLGYSQEQPEAADFDPLMLAAQGFQESLLNQEARSPVGAIGLMQVMPATGKELGVGDITIADSNVHAATKHDIGVTLSIGWVF